LIAFKADVNALGHKYLLCFNFTLASQHPSYTPWFILVGSNTVLEEAAKRGDVEMCKLLLEAKAEPDFVG
jgi:hypothetical protein